MKIISFSDLHLEFGTKFLPPSTSDADLMILSGDIIVFSNYKPLDNFLKHWKKSVIYVAGNHEYYSCKPISEENERFKAWLSENHKNVHFLNNESVEIDGVNFFGGTMWTDFNGGNKISMEHAFRNMNDYRRIYTTPVNRLEPSDTIKLHNEFAEKLISWLKKELIGERVIVTHHAPTINPVTKYGNSPLMPAFNSLDMLPIIEKYKPKLWFYGHTHECDYHMIGKTRIISNQLGYPMDGKFECAGFDKAGALIEI